MVNSFPLEAMTDDRPSMQSAPSTRVAFDLRSGRRKNFRCIRPKHIYLRHIYLRHPIGELNALRILPAIERHYSVK